MTYFVFFVQKNGIVGGVFFKNRSFILQNCDQKNTWNKSLYNQIKAFCGLVSDVLAWKCAGVLAVLEYVCVNEILLYKAWI